MILGLDVGYAALGWALFDYDRLESLGVIVTEKSDEPASADLMRRSREIAQEVRGLCEGRSVTVACMEAVSWPRSGAVIGKMGAAYGAVSAALWFSMVGVARVDHISPQGVRRALGLPKGAGKAELLTAVREHRGCEKLDALLASVRTKALRQHPIDACAVVLAAWAGEGRS